MLYNPKAFFTHAALLDQGCPHCPKFPTAASRRSLGRVSVPVWLIVLSDQLLIVALVSFYPTNLLIRHRPLLLREALRSPAFTLRSYAVLANLSTSYPPQQGTFRCITHPFATRHQDCSRAAVRLACVRHAASVQSEPGSNSSVQYLCGAEAPRSFERSLTLRKLTRSHPKMKPNMFYCASTLITFEATRRPESARRSPSSAHTYRLFGC